MSLNLIQKYKINISEYKKNEWNSMINGKIKVPIWLGKNFIEKDGAGKDSYNETKVWNFLADRVLKILENFFIILRKFDWATLDEKEVLQKELRFLIYKAIESHLINNEFYQNKIDEVINFGSFQKTRRRKDYLNGLDSFTEDVRLAFLRYFNDFKIVDIEDGQDIKKEVFLKEENKNYFTIIKSYKEA